MRLRLEEKKTRSNVVPKNVSQGLKVKSSFKQKIWEKNLKFKSLKCKFSHFLKQIRPQINLLGRI